MMKLVSMENSKDALRDERRAAPPASAGDDYDPPRFPYGTKLCLEGEQLERLGIGRPESGTVFKLEGVARVVGYSEDERADETQERVELQITELGLEQDGTAERARRDDDRLNQLATGR